MASTEQARAPLDANLRHDARALKPMSGSALKEAPLIPLNLKRKRHESTTSQELGGPFIILDSGSTTHSARLKLIPRILILRSTLPLAYLDLDTPYGEDAAPKKRFFSARVKALERSEVTESMPYESKILIVEKHDGNELYAVEGVRHNVYALCRLSNWVTLEDFEEGAVKTRKIVHGGSATNTTKADPWWKAAAVELNGIDDSKRSDFLSACGVKLAMKPQQKRRPLEPEIEVSKAGVTTTIDSPLEHNEHVETITGNDHTQSADPVDIISMIRAQYLEALYMSKTSLAYFAKGPLSRARAAVQNTSLTTMSELNQSLREKILSISTNDKKYNETLPNLMKEIPVGVTSEDESSLLHDEIRKSKKRKKISKGGLYPGEEEYAVKWWLRCERNTLTGRPEDSHEDRVKVALLEQRARETQLQIILMLEILSTEATSVPIATILSSVPATGDDNTTERPAQTKKPKKPQNLEILLDVLIDRLCIWHTTSQEDSGAAHDIQQRRKLTDSTSDGDRLQSFCVEVVVPFYATRLPLELYRSICQKLGGPLAPSPAQIPLHKASASSRDIPKSGTNLQRTDPKSRNPLQRVLTDDKTARRKSHPPLTRSATDSALPRIKRELSDLALSTIPATRPSLQHSKRYSQREVDLTAVSHATEAKLQRKAAIEHELQGAIAALKKPNPRLAVQELVESADRRVAGAAKPRKSKNPVRNPLGQGVQVMATPKHNRVKNILPRLPRALRAALAAHEEEPDAIPPSSELRIPSSSIKPPALPPSTNALHLPSLIPTQIATPSHRPSKVRPPTSNNEAHLSHPSTTALPLPSLHNADDDDEDELSQPSPALQFLPFKRPLPPARTPSFDSPTRTPSRRAAPRSSALVAETPSRKPLGRRAQGGREGAVVGRSIASKSFGGGAMGVKVLDGSVGEIYGGPGSKVSGSGSVAGGEQEVGRSVRSGESREKSIYHALGWEEEEEGDVGFDELV